MAKLIQTQRPISSEEACARLNDDCRWMRGDHQNYRHMITPGVNALIDHGNMPTRILNQARINSAIRNHIFSHDSSPERDFGAFEFQGEQLFFKIAAYDRNLEYGSPDPEDASVTIRVMTIMLPSEY